MASIKYDKFLSKFLENYMYHDGRNSEIAKETGLKWKASYNGEEFDLVWKWNDNRGTFDVELPYGVTGQMFQELHFHGKCTSALVDGDPVQFDGAEGGHYKIKKAVKSEINAFPRLFMGVATQSGEIGDFVKVTWFGEVNELDTTAYYSADPAKQVIYYDSDESSLEDWTFDAPVYPNKSILAFAVVKHSTGAAENGVILVRPDLVSLENHVVVYENLNSRLKGKDVVTDTVDLSANGIGTITLAADTAFAFTGFELNKTYLLVVDPDGFTPSFDDATKHIIVEGSVEFDDTTKVYISLTCIDDTSGSEKLLTSIVKEKV
jgi:hypothetical protein